MRASSGIVSSTIKRFLELAVVEQPGPSLYVVYILYYNGSFIRAQLSRIAGMMLVMLLFNFLLQYSFSTVQYLKKQGTRGNTWISNQMGRLV